MLNVAAASSITSANPNPAASSIAAQGNGYVPPGAALFSQVFAGSKAAAPQATPKTIGAPRSQPAASRGSSQAPGVAPHSAKDTALQPGTTPNPPAATTPAVPFTIAVPPASEWLLKPVAISTEDEEGATPFDVAAKPDGAGYAPSKSAPETAQVQNASVVSSVDATDSAAADDDHIVEGVLSANEQQSDQGDAAQPAETDPSQSADSAKSSMHTSPQPQAAADLSVVLPQIKTAVATDLSAVLQQIKNAAAPSPSPLPDLARHAAEQAQVALPNAAMLYSLSGEGAAANSPKSTSENQQSIAQRIQPSIAALDATQQLGASATVVGASAATGNGSGDASAQNGSHSSGQSSSQPSGQPLTQSHSSGDDKVSGASDTAQSAQSADGTSGIQQSIASAGASAASAAAASAGITIQSPHMAAQTVAQVAASTPISGSSKLDAAATPSPSQQPSSTATLPAALPRSLNDVSQATQLYQRVGGAEMHIAMDTDVLGSIDLRAVVHQGSLSATIGVQRADVQTLLVNELPALQHSLAEKNLQVAQISVLAGSIGSGTDANAQPQQQQNRQSGGAAPSSIFSDDQVANLASRVPTSELAALTENSARLSVLA